MFLCILAQCIFFVGQKQIALPSMQYIFSCMSLGMQAPDDFTEILHWSIPFPLDETQIQVELLQGSKMNHVSHNLEIDVYSNLNRVENISLNIPLLLDSIL